MKRLAAIVIAAVVAVGCTAAPAPTPQIIEKIVQAPAPTPITKTIAVTPKVCLDALDKAEQFMGIQMEISEALIDEDFDTALRLFGDGEGPAFVALDAYSVARDACIAAAEVGS